MGRAPTSSLPGTRFFFGANFARLLGQMNFMELIREMRAASQLHGYGATWAARYLVNALLPQGLRDAIRALAGRETAVPGWLDVARLGAIPRDPFRMSSAGPLSIHSLSLQQLTGSNLQMLLHWEDRDSMAHSVEARVPFLDHKLVEFVLGLPDDFKIYRGVTKRVLREGLRDVLPEVIKNRMSKLGFATPEEHWVKQEQPERFRQAVADAVETCSGILRADALRFTDDVIAGRRPFDFSVWRMISFARWIDRFGLRLP